MGNSGYEGIGDRDREERGGEKKRRRRRITAEEDLFG